MTNCRSIAFNHNYSTALAHAGVYATTGDTRVTHHKVTQHPTFAGLYTLNINFTYNTPLSTRPLTLDKKDAGTQFHIKQIQIT